MDADLTVIGAGVVGLAVASEVADNNLRLFVIEKNETHGRGISSRNSEVIHAGIYYPHGSLKASLCVEGRELIYEICRKHKIPYRRRGKLIIAVTDEELPALERLAKNAADCGVTSLELCDRGRTRVLEPGVSAAGALFSPETGTVSAHALMDYFFHAARAKGAEIAYGTEVVGVEPVNSGYRISTVSGTGERFEFVTAQVVNAAGLHSDAIAGMTGTEYHLHYCKGDYFSLSNIPVGLVRRLIYPVPQEKGAGLGVHLTIDLGGRMKLGPDATYIGRSEHYTVDPRKRLVFYKAAARFLPFIRAEDLSPDMSGIRPKLSKPGEGFRDFVIQEDLPGLINLVGIESPGLTAAPAIAREVKRILKGARRA